MLQILLCAVSIIAIFYIAQFAAVAVVRAFYPFELEWIEGAYVDEMRWIADGNAVYSEPSIDFIPVNKTPLFFILAGNLMKVFGAGFVLPRLLSIFFTVSCFIMLFLIVFKGLQQSSAAGLVAAGLYAASFRFAGAWMDLAKPDSMFLCLILAAFFIGRQHKDCRGQLLSGLLYTLAYYTKQLALPIVLVTATISLIASRGRQWLLWLSVSIAGPLVFLVLDTTSNGWFSFYTFDSLVYHAIECDIWSFWIELIRQMWPALLISLLYLVFLLTSGDLLPISDKRDLWENIGLCAALLLTSWSVFRKIWTYDNGFMPACAGLAILTGLGSAYVLQLMYHRSQRSRFAAHMLKGVVLVLLLCQFAILSYNPLDQLPTEEGRKIWEEFLSHLRDLSGRVLVFNHGFVNHLAGKNTHLHSAPYASVMGWIHEPQREDHRSRRKKVAEILEEAIEEQVFDWSFAGKPRDRWLPYYVLSDKESFVFRPLTGPPASPEFFFVKNPVAKGGEFPLTDTNLDFLLSEGWDRPEHWGRWAVGHRASMQVALEQGCDYDVTIDAFPFCVPEFADQTLEARWNGVFLGRHEFLSCEPQSLTFELNSEAITGRLNHLQFEFDKAISPADVDLSGDERPLAVGFTSITFTQKGRESEK